MDAKAKAKVAAAIPATRALLPREELLFEGFRAIVPGFGSVLLLIATLGLGWVYLYLRARSTNYRITTRRIIIEHGLLSKRLEQIDTFRIKDFVVERPFGQRLLGTGNLRLVTLDASTPIVEIDAVRTDVLALYERLRAASDEERNFHGVKVVE
jgi:uncharacterized membrane protein YdbT with pleckstrin-like domain